MIETPSWSLVLGYEHAIRAKACELMNEGNKSTNGKPMDVKNAIEVARDCPDVRQEEFIEKLNVQGSSGARSSNQGDPGAFEARKPKKEKSRNEKRYTPDKKEPRAKPRKDSKGGKGDGKGGKGPKGLKTSLP